jgi:hypothetical protein
MLRLIAVILAVLIPSASLAQEQRIPVSVSRSGQDQVGSLFATALKQELLRSTRYALSDPGKIKNGLRFYIDLITVDPAESETERGKRCVVSVVIQDFGLPNSYPVADMWYHKVIVVDRNAVAKTAKELLEDMDARRCKYVKNAVGGCPKEKFPPRL